MFVLSLHYFFPIKNGPTIKEIEEQTSDLMFDVSICIVREIDGPNYNNRLCVFEKMDKIIIDGTQVSLHRGNGNGTYLIGGEHCIKSTILVDGESVDGFKVVILYDARYKNGILELIPNEQNVHFSL